MKQDRSIVLIIGLLFSMTSCQNNKEKTIFELNGQSKLHISNRSVDSVKVSLSNWVYIPIHEEKVDTTIGPNQSLELNISSQTKHYYDVIIDDIRYRIFSVKGRTNKISISGEGKTLAFAGELSGINEFLRTRDPDSDWQPRTLWYQGKGTISDLLVSYDSITNSQKEQINVSASLPAWYSEFEKSRLDYVNAESKLSALGYRKKMLSISDSVPNDYLAKVVKDLRIERPDMIGVTAYMRFVGWYLTFLNDPFLKDNIPSSKKEWIISSTQRIIIIEEHITDQKLKELILADKFLKLIDKQKAIWNDEWLTHISDQELLAMIEHQISAISILEKGSKAPYFYLSDLDSIYHEPDDFENKILLINFWATWCKPCYQEFEDENELVEKFKDQPVEIVNICIDSDRYKWKEVIHKYSLKTKHLFASSSWSEKLNEGFGITALPHSVLIDHNGSVIQNNCPRPSAGVDEFITKALNEMKAESTK